MNEDERIPIGNRVTIYQRGKKKIWTADFWHDDQHRRWSMRSRNKKTAVERATKLAHQLETGEYSSNPAKTTVSDAIDRYLEYVKTEDRSPRTISQYQSTLGAFRKYCTKQRVNYLSAITPSVFDSYRGTRRDNLKIVSLNQIGIVIKQFLKWCVARDMLASNPLRNIKLRQVPRAAKNVLIVDQVKKILAASSGQQQVMLAVLATTGMRRGELRHLRVEDVDLDDRWIHIVDREGARTKTRCSRKIPIHPALVPLLTRHRPSGGTWFFASGPSTRYPSGGNWISTNELNSRLLETLALLGFPRGRALGGFTAHSFRHFFETESVNAQVPQFVVDLWLGHSSGRAIPAGYYHLTDAESHRVMQELKFPQLVLPELPEVAVKE